MVSWILLILTVITFALGTPVLVQDKRQAWVDVVHVPEVVTILGKRIMDKDLDVVWHPVHVHHVNILGEPPAAPSLNVLEGHAPPPNPAEVQLPVVHAPPPNPADSDRESIDLIR